MSFAASYFCEWSSSGPKGWFPFGHYTYLPTTREEEIWVGHLPFMDFLSFSFLVVASLGVVARVWGLSLGEVLTRPVKTTWPVFLMSDILFFGIDMVIDPVALRGNRWFLGQIYYYPQGGSYFGVPVANFVGWAVLGLMIMLLWRSLGAMTQLLARQTAIDRWGPSFLWLSVYLFNLGIALYRGEFALFLSDLVVLALLILMLISFKRKFV
jgi:putative membrane protein